MRRFASRPIRATQWTLICGVLLPALLTVLVACADQTAQDSSARLPVTVSGVVVNTNGPVAGAIVQVQGTQNRTTTDARGAFTLHGEGLGKSHAVTVTAWAEGHYIGWTTLDPRRPIHAEGISITLRPLFDGDNHEYTWFSEEGIHGSASCGLCHREYTEWEADAHAQAAVNPRFISMFRGTDLSGRRGQPTRFAGDGKSVLPPDPALPDTGPGFRLDHPDRAGTCATCHTPMAARIPTTNSCAWSGCHATGTADNAEAVGVQPSIRGVTPVGLHGIALEGIGCEFCHKIREVILDPSTGLPYSDMPGILSLRLARPHGDAQVFFGTLTDVSRERDSYLPLQAQSEFCAACHFGVFGGVVSNMKMTGGTVIYNSYGEWLHSPYSRAGSPLYRTCQDCHMPIKDTPYSVFPHRGGVARHYPVYNDHTMLGPSNEAFLRSAVTMTSTATIEGSTVRVEVGLTNTGAGHAVPTDAPMRSVMLVIEAVDADGRSVPLKSGPTLPDWTGDYAGRPGKAFARLLRDNWSGEMPATAFWRPTTEVADTRLFPFVTDSTTYVFDWPAGLSGTVRVKLVYRRAFYKLAQQKGWHDPDIIMATSEIPIRW
ncbi:MAG: carboxypeptidase-like regulatory domain-containing protein [Thermoflexales bacterium]|nr:carboxypeptidase-like regulatory domain-containing protein [Thermoflexales bacterium]